MIIESLLIKKGMEEKRFFFSPRNNLIFSRDNSRGKTTLLRLLLYSLGYSIPGTKRFFFNNCETESSLITDSGESIKLVRPSSDYIVFHSRVGQQTICLPDQKNRLDELLYGTSNSNVLNNLLGAFYLDQEKGWTLLNRGTVIGSIHFNVEELIQGLSDRDCTELKEQEARLCRELSRFQQISNVAKYKESLELESGSIITERIDNEIEVQIAQKQLELNDVRKELRRIDKVLQGNRQVKSFVEEMKLLVRTPSGESIPVTADNLVGLNDSIEFLIAKRKIKATEYKELSNALTVLIQEKQSNEEPKLFSVESIANIFDEMVQKFPFGHVNVEKVISELKNSIANVRSQIIDATRRNNDVVASLYESIVKYADELNIGNSSSIAQSYLFTSNLKELSGALLHKTVFAFRLAYLLEIKKRIGIKLPIILDSPSGKELDQANIQLMMSILNRDFSGHQIIIASIYHYSLPELIVIELQRMLMENALVSENST
jgi:hypothetical protein